MSKIKNGGLGQYGAEPCEQQQFGTTGVERVKPNVEQLSAADLCERTQCSSPGKCEGGHWSMAT